MNKTHADTHWSPNENVTTNADGGTSRTFVPSGTAMTAGQLQHASTGWICPKCGRGLAPHTSYCPCYMDKLTITCRADFEPGDLSFGPSSICANTIKHLES